jgi:hypothetical protein
MLQIIKLLAKIVKFKKRILGFPNTEDDTQNADEIMPKENNISTNSNLFWNPRGLESSLVFCMC